MSNIPKLRCDHCDNGIEQEWEFCAWCSAPIAGNVHKDPTPEMLDDPQFNAIWNVIKSWDINVPGAYSGYCGATGNHVRAIMDALEVAGLIIANAHLIAAVPELLAALRGVVAIADRKTVEFDRARAAIAKATAV